jgi:hypothetical protein
MENITFTASATFTQEQIDYFASFKGWDSDHELTSTEFVKKYVKEKMAFIIGQATKEAIKQKHEQNKNEELTEFNNSLLGIITIE